MYGKTFSGIGNEFNYALDHIEDALRHEHAHVLRARVQGVSTSTGARVNLEGNIIQVVRRSDPSYIVALVFDTPNRLLTVGSHTATKEDIAAESITIAERY